MILRFLVVCVLHAEDSSKRYKNWKTQEIDGNLSDSPKIAGVS